MENQKEKKKEMDKKTEGEQEAAEDVAISEPSGEPEDAAPPSAVIGGTDAGEDLPVPDGEPDPDDEPLPKYVLPVFLGVLALIAALVIVLFVAPGLTRTKSVADSSSAPFSSLPPESVSSPAPSSSSAPPRSEEEKEPDFVLYGASPYLMEEGEPYSYMTEDIDEKGTSLVGVITARSYMKGEPTKAAQAFAAETGTDITGYESRRVTFEISFEDGYPDMGSLCTDYYNALALDDEFEMIGGSADGEYEYFAGSIMINGEERGVYLLRSYDYDYEGAFLASEGWDVLVPEGYDGVCVGYYNTMLEQS